MLLPRRRSVRVAALVSVTAVGEVKEEASEEVSEEFPEEVSEEFPEEVSEDPLPTERVASDDMTTNQLLLLLLLDIPNDEARPSSDFGFRLFSFPDPLIAAACQSESKQQHINTHQHSSG